MAQHIQPRTRNDSTNKREPFFDLSAERNHIKIDPNTALLYPLNNPKHIENTGPFQELILLPNQANKKEVCTKRTHDNLNINCTRRVNFNSEVVRTNR